ncbi:MAG: phosphatidylglycerophosphatase A [Pseudomonadota bacterium]
MSKAPVVRWSQLRDPVLFLAFGFGSGLAPKAPGTAGTLAAVPLFLAVAAAGQGAVLLVTAVLCVAGIWLCGRAAERLDCHDHPGIVWDEFAGLFITLSVVPPTALNIVFGFVFFRLFDVLKPWPIRAVDHSMSGGLGIMLDDVIAGVFAAAALLLTVRFLPVL